MQTIEGSVTRYDEGLGATVEDKLFTYSEAERQQNEINAENAKRLFTPEFIPFYPDVQKAYGLTDKQTLLYGFIRFYMANSKAGRFYFTNEQLGQILGCSGNLVNQNIKTLRDQGLIATTTKVKAGGGTIRFITRVATHCHSEYQPIAIPNSNPLLPNNNKIKDNKINLSLEQPKFSLREGVTPVVLEEIASQYGVKVTFVANCWDSAQNWLDANGKTMKDYKAFLKNWVKREATAIAMKQSSGFRPKGGVVDARGL